MHTPVSTGTGTELQANSTFLGPNGTSFARSHFKAQKSLDFQGPPLPLPLVMDLARLKTAVVYHGETAVARVSHVAAFPPTIDISSATGVSNVSGVSVAGVPALVWLPTMLLAFLLLLVYALVPTFLQLQRYCRWRSCCYCRPSFCVVIIKQTYSIRLRDYDYRTFIFSVIGLSDYRLSGHYLVKLSHYRLSELPQECSNSQWHILHL